VAAEGRKIAIGIKEVSSGIARIEFQGAMELAVRCGPAVFEMGSYEGEGRVRFGERVVQRKRTHGVFLSRSGGGLQLNNRSLKAVALARDRIEKVGTFGVVL
jgi:hypothetical protein